MAAQPDPCRGKRIVYAASPESREIIKIAGQLFAENRVALVKNERKTKAGFIRLANGTAYFIKWYITRSWLSGLGQRLFGSRAARSIRGAHLLMNRGFLVPKPLAAMETLSRGVIVSSYLLSEAIENGYTLSQFIDRAKGPAGHSYSTRSHALSCVAREVRRLHDAGLFTSDLQETNLVLVGKNNSLDIYFVDLDGFWCGSSDNWPARLRNLVQLDRSVGRFMSRPERLRFLRSYLGTMTDQARLRNLAIKLIAERRKKDRKVGLRQQLRSLGWLRMALHD